MAVECLEKGGVIIYPTDTVYGLGCDIRQKKALEKVYRIKRMAEDHPVAFVCPDLGDIARYAVVDDRAYRVMRRLLPGPYTFILQSTREVPKMVLRPRKTVGIRVPHHEVALALVRALGSPILSTSASINGEQLNDPDDLVARFKEVDMVLDAGWGGLDPSTIVDLTGSVPDIVRAGAGPIDVF
jgi:tRNA threonylcarbamoyl adenosine modification protein (Sua5/YciO/YrdC/YwlC family)